MKAKPDWPEEFYRNSFYNPASAEAIKAAPAEAAFLIEKLKLKKGASNQELWDQKFMQFEGPLKII